MSDVVEDFSTLDGVKSRFEAWKEEDPEAYSDAFVSLCLPKIVSPLVRLQLLFWNPLTVSSNMAESTAATKNLISLNKV